MLDKNDIQLIAEAMKPIIEDTVRPIIDETVSPLQEIVKINITLENQVLPQLQMLAEGQQTILEKLIPVSRVEALEEEVKLLKVMLMQVTEEVQKLKKAQ